MKLTDIGPLRARMHLLESFPVFCASPSVEGLEAHYIFLFFYVNLFLKEVIISGIEGEDGPSTSCHFSQTTKKHYHLVKMLGENKKKLHLQNTFMHNEKCNCSVTIYLFSPSINCYKQVDL